MASDSIGALYLDNGEMAGTGQAPVKGPKAISAFLHTFDAYRVLSETMTSDRLRFRADTAIQGGNFVQRVQLPAGDTVVARGTFEVTWVKSGTTGWRVRRMTTGPAPVN